MIVMRLFLTMPWVCLQFVIVVFPDHTHLLCVGICNAYLNIGHVVGMFYDWPDRFY